MVNRFIQPDNSGRALLLDPKHFLSIRNEKPTDVTVSLKQ